MFVEVYCCINRIKFRDENVMPLVGKVAWLEGIPFDSRGEKPPIQRPPPTYSPNARIKAPPGSPNRGPNERTMDTYIYIKRSATRGGIDGPPMPKMGAYLGGCNILHLPPMWRFHLVNWPEQGMVRNVGIPRRVTIAGWRIEANREGQTRTGRGCMEAGRAMTRYGEITSLPTGEDIGISTVRRLQKRGGAIFWTPWKKHFLNFW